MFWNKHTSQYSFWKKYKTLLILVALSGVLLLVLQYLYQESSLDDRSLAAGNQNKLTRIYENTDSNLIYTGRWRVGERRRGPSNGSYTYSITQGDEVSLDFSGNSITYIRTLDRDRGKVSVFIDGQLVDKVDNYSQSRKWQKPRVFDNLTIGNHRIRLVNSGEKNPRSRGITIDIDAFVVTTKLVKPSPLVNDEQVLCQRSFGEWREFPDSCADKCGFTTDSSQKQYCAKFPIQSCDCGQDRCWNGTRCVSDTLASPLVKPISRPSATPLVAVTNCLVTGCNRELCVDEEIAKLMGVTDCAYRPEYACYQQYGQCGVQANGQCGWAATPQLQACLQEVR